MKRKQTDKYDDIIHLPRPRSGRYPRMSRHDRAAQFSPFAALTGFEAAIAETERLTDSRAELDEGGRQLLDQQMGLVLEALDTQPKVTITWFCYDERKAGGVYIRTTGCVKKIDTYSGKLILTDGQSIPLGEVYSIVLEKEKNGTA